MTTLYCVSHLPVKCYRLSSAQRLGTATMNLGYCYLRGHAVPADKQEALRLFRLAVDQGEPLRLSALPKRWIRVTAPVTALARVRPAWRIRWPEIAR